MEEKLKAMTLTEAEVDTLVDDEGPDELSDQLVAYCLVGKLLTSGPFNPDARRNTMKNLWKPTKGLVVRDNIFGFQSFSKVDREKVIDQGPWSFDGKLLILKEVKRGEQPIKMTSNVARFWVKSYPIPVVKVQIKIGSICRVQRIEPFRLS